MLVVENEPIKILGQDLLDYIGRKKNCVIDPNSDYTAFVLYDITYDYKKKFIEDHKLKKMGFRSYFLQKENKFFHVFFKPLDSNLENLPKYEIPEFETSMEKKRKGKYDSAVFEILKEGKKTIDEIMKNVSASKPTVYNILKKAIKNGIVVTEKMNGNEKRKGKKPLIYKLSEEKGS